MGISWRYIAKTGINKEGFLFRSTDTTYEQHAINLNKHRRLRDRKPPLGNHNSSPAQETINLARVDDCESYHHQEHENGVKDV